MALMKRNDANAVSKVKGPIRCHTCQLMCHDADHYLSHKCEPKHSSDWIASHSASTNSSLEL
jgi:hypothetical protein